MNITEKIDKYLNEKKGSKNHTKGEIIKAMGGEEKIFSAKTEKELYKMMDKAEEKLNKKAFKQGYSESGMDPSSGESIVNMWLKKKKRQ